MIQYRRMTNRPLSIALLIDSERACNQYRLIGIFSYIRAHAPNWRTTILPGTLAAETADGCISDEWHAAQAVQKADVRPPIVAIDTRADVFRRFERVSHVKVDNDDIAERALAHFDATGTYGAFVFVHDPAESEWSVIRERRFRKGALKRNEAYFEMRHPSRDDGAALTRLLNARSKPIAVFCANDKCASDVLNVCKAADLQVPAQIALLGVDNDSFLCDCCEPSLSSVTPDFEREGFTAARELDRLLRHPNLAARTARRIAATGVVVRSSTRPGYSAETLVQSCTDFIRRNFGRKLSVQAVSRAMGVSRRLAEMRFRQIRGVSIGAFIAATRIRHAQHLLKTSKMPLSEIARDSGFSNASYFTQAFKRLTGTTPRNWADESRPSATPGPRDGRCAASRPDGAGPSPRIRT